MEYRPSQSQCVIDIGGSKVVVCVGQYNEKIKKFVVDPLCVLPSKGTQKGGVVNRELLESQILKAVTDVEQDYPDVIKNVLFLHFHI